MSENRIYQCMSISKKKLRLGWFVVVFNTFSKTLKDF